jgi:hypothetical protein
MVLPEGKRPLWRPRRRWEDVIRMVFGEIDWGCEVDLVGSGEGPAAGCCECGDEPSCSSATELVIVWVWNMVSQIKTRTLSV